MRDLNNIDGVGKGGGAPGPVQDKESGSDKKPPSDTEKAAAWWDDFAKAVENPNISTYDFLKNSFLKKFELDGTDGLGEFVGKAHKKTIKEVIALTDPAELRDTIKKLQKNRLFFDYRTRVALQCAAVLLDTFISAKEEYEKDLKKRMHRGQKKPSEAQQKREIQKIVDEKLAEPEVAESIEAAAAAMTGKDQAEVSKTVEEASKQLREKSSLKKISEDVVGVSKKYVTLDNMVNIGVHALPLITWQYRWAIAVVFGAYVSRMSAYHGYKSFKARWIDGDRELAKEEGHKALTAMKAAGGNVLAIGISPLVGKLPARLAVWGGFVASTVYNKSIEIAQGFLKKKREVAPEGVKAKAASSAKGAWKWTAAFFKDNLDTLVTLAAKAVKKEAPGKVTENIETAAKKVPFSKARRVLTGIWGVSAAAGRRTRGLLTSVFTGAAAAKHVDAAEAAAEESLRAAEQEGGEAVPMTSIDNAPEGGEEESSSVVSEPFNDSSNAESGEPEGDEAETPESDIETETPEDVPTINGPS